MPPTQYSLKQRVPDALSLRGTYNFVILVSFAGSNAAYCPLIELTAAARFSGCPLCLMSLDGLEFTHPLPIEPILHLRSHMGCTENAAETLPRCE